MSITTFSPESFFDLTDPVAASLFSGCRTVWEPLHHIKAHLDRLVGAGQTVLGEVAEGAWLGEAPIHISKGAVVEPGAYIIGPAYIGPGAVVRHGAYVRENVILLAGSLLGHASEAKNSILLENAHAPHFNYVGDSILGARANLGAGTKLSNLAINSAKDPVTGKRPTIRFHYDGEEIDTGLAKLGAILGDDVQTGCNSVLNPGCIVGRGSLIYANLSLRKGYHPANSVLKLRQNTATIPRRDL